MKNFMIILVTSLVTFSCASLSTNNKTLIIDTEKDNQSVELLVGQNLKIEAEKNPSTGFDWHIKVPADCAVEFVKEDSKKIYNDGRVGAPVTGVYEFKALKKGECVVEFDYSRAWEGQSNNPKKVKITVK